MYDASDDPYTYDGSTVLINKLDLRDAGDLEAFEAEIGAQRATEPLPKGNLNFAHYCLVHHHLFQDVYEWAGNVRTVRISKQSSPFCFPENIGTQATKLFSDLQDANFYQGLSATEFAKRSAHFLGELNAIHAFREGNGRTQLSFLALLADHAGHPLDMTKLDPRRMLSAMIASFDGDETQLHESIEQLMAI